VNPALPAAAIVVLASVCSGQVELPSIKITVPKFVTGDPDTKPQTAECPRFASVKARQQKNVWCWAACAEMVYRYRGKKLSQEKIAERIHGRGEDGAAKVKAASVYEVLLALAGAEGKSDRGDRFLERYNAEAAKASKSGKGVTIDVGSYLSSWMEEESVNTDEMIDEIKRRQPVVIGMAKDPRFEGGHAMVVYGVTYKPAKKNMLERAISGENGTTISRAVGIRKFEIVTLKVMDPWTGEARELSGKEFAEHGDFMMSQRRAVAILKKQDDSVKAAR
jgi:hypothetical protein